MLHPQKKSLHLFTIAAAIAALVGVTTFLIGFEWQLDVWQPFQLLESAAQDDVFNGGINAAEQGSVTIVLIIFTAIFVIGLALYTLAHPRRMIANIILMLLLTLLFQGVSLSSTALPTVNTDPAVEVMLEEPASELEPLIDIDAQPPRGYAYVAALLLASIAVFIAWRWPRNTPPPFEKNQLQSFQQDAAAAIEAIESGNNLRDTILTCYSKMVRSVQQNKGIGLSREMTAREFESRLLARGLPAAAIQRLTRLFESARYGNDTMGERERREAVSCLSEIVAIIEPSPVTSEGVANG